MRTEGAGFFAKAVLQKLLRDSNWVKQQRAARRKVEFKLETPNKMAAE
jgi:hypothetical protein